MIDHEQNDPSTADVDGVRDMLAGLPAPKLDDVASNRIRQKAAETMSVPPAPSRLRATASYLRRAEPLLAFAVAAIYIGLTFQAILAGY